MMKGTMSKNDRRIRLTQAASNDGIIPGNLGHQARAIDQQLIQPGRG
jgi:hypothetical protein